MMSITFHPQMDGQLERAIQILENGHASWILRVVGWSIYPWWSSPTTTIIRKAYGWYPMRQYMGGRVNLRSVGRRWESDPLRVQTWLETLLRRWTLYESIFSWLGAGRRDTPTDDDNL